MEIIEKRQTDAITKICGAQGGSRGQRHNMTPEMKRDFRLSIRGETGPIFVSFKLVERSEEIFFGRITL